MYLRMSDSSQANLSKIVTIKTFRNHYFYALQTFLSSFSYKQKTTKILEKYTKWTLTTFSFEFIRKFLTARCRAEILAR